jgi:hypothetical protein
MPTIACITTCLDHWDYLRPPQVIHPDVEYVCFSNLPMPECKPWRIVPCPALTGSVGRDSRIPKILPHLCLDADYSIYHDANFAMQCDPLDLIERRLTSQDCDIAMYRHPARECVYEEAKVCIEMSHDAVRRGFPETPPIAPIQEQVAKLRADGHPPAWGLWACGIVIRRHTDMIAWLNERWWQEFAAGSSRDQIAFPPALRGLGCRINTIPGNVYQVKDWGFNFHAAWTDRYRPEQNEWRDRELARTNRLREFVAASRNGAYKPAQNDVVAQEVCSVTI